MLQAREALTYRSALGEEIGIGCETLGQKEIKRVVIDLRGSEPGCRVLSNTPHGDSEFKHY